MATMLVSRQRRRGLIVPLLAVMLITLLGFAALTIDLGNIHIARSEMQAAADASALAGASGLMQMGSTARQRALEFGALNVVAQNELDNSELDVLIGNWSGINFTFTETPDEGVDDVLPNAVQVNGTRQDMRLFFAPLMGRDTADISRGAIALVGSGRCAGIWGLEGITADGDITTDSYDAREGRYGPGNMRPNGDICSCQDIVANGSIQIFGDAMYGDGYAFIPYGSSYEVRGVVREQEPCGTPSFNADFDAASTTNDNGTIGLTYRGNDPFQGNPSHLYVTGNDHLTLTGGTYYFNSALVDGRAYIEVTGPTVMYIDGSATFTGGGIVNSTQDPRDLVIYVTGPTVRLQGGAGFYGAVVAPTADVILEGNSEYFGAVLGRTLDIDGNSVIHVDEATIFDLFGIRSVAPILVQ